MSDRTVVRGGGGEQRVVREGTVAPKGGGVVREGTVAPKGRGRVVREGTVAPKGGGE